MTALQRHFARFFFCCYGDQRDLHKTVHSFPTRRSSDLVATPVSSGPKGTVASAGFGEMPTSSGPRDRKSHTSELQSHGLISYAVFCLKKKHAEGVARAEPADSRRRMEGRSQRRA